MNQNELLEVASEVRARAYAPYSHFEVGAALLASDGRVFAGTNVENISYGLTMCAERVATGAAVAAGATDYKLLALVSDSEQPVVPCGACRQVLAEFAPQLRIVSATTSGVTAEFHLGQLLPTAKQGILG